MEVVKNARTLKSLQKTYCFEFDEQHKYVTKSGPKYMYNFDKEYVVEYVDGCFYPYIFKTDRKPLTCIAQLYHDGVAYSNVKYLKNGDFVVIMPKQVSKKELSFLTKKYYNLVFNYRIHSEYAPELDYACIYVKRKMGV